MSRISKTMQSPLIKAIAVASAALFAGLSLADSNDESLQLAQTSDGFNTEQKYMASCFACHSTGAAGAPTVAAGDYEDQWAERLEKGMDAVVQNVIDGMNAMPAKGLCFDCTDEDLRALVDYMLESSK